MKDIALGNKIKSTVTNSVTKLKDEIKSINLPHPFKNHEVEIEGVPIVLTGSATDMSDCNLNPFRGNITAFPAVISRKILLERLYPPGIEDNGKAVFAPYGLRKVEALLLKDFDEKDIVICHPNNLHKFVGNKTKVIGITAMDPMGLAYVSTTYTSIFGLGEPMNRNEFHVLIKHASILKYKPKIIVGGGGAWQIERERMQKEYGIDTLVYGVGERVVGKLFHKAVQGKSLPKIVKGKLSSLKDIPIIKDASIYGLVEITRGCGRGCQFCSPNMRKKFSFPIDHIMKEVEINIKNGSKMIFPNSEDVFLYDSKGFIPNRKSVLELFEKIASYEGVEYIHLSHASMAPVVYAPKMVEELSQILVQKTQFKFKGKPFTTAEMGIESGSTKIMQKYMKGKALPYEIKNWHDIVTQAIGILNDNSFYPLCTLITGFPSENENDTIQTLELLDKLKSSKTIFIPLLFVPLEDCVLSKAKGVSLKNLTPAQWDFIATCWRHNLDVWKPEIKPKLMFSTLIAYLLYYRWKHGKSVIYPAMKTSGFPEDFLKKWVYKGCEPEYCDDESIEEKIK